MKGKSMSKYGYDGSKPVAITFIPIYRRLPYVKIGSSLPISKRGLKHTAVCLLAFLPLLFFAATSSIGADYYLVTRAVDGDTIVLATKDRVRLIGVDTPELHHPRKPVQYYAEEAYRFTQMIVGGKTVRLESTTGKGGIVTAASWPLSISPTTPSSTPS